MKKIDVAKSMEAISGFAHKTVDAGKKAIVSADKGIKTMIEKTKQERQERMLKKLNPLFPDVYNSKEFNIPNVIKIVDDAVRRGMDLCDGAIGWTSFEKATEVLYLYDEFIPLSGITFVPTVSCDTVYCVDPFDRKRFISADCIFTKANEERIAELKHIAHALGAKRCSIEISEENVQADSRSLSATLTKGNTQNAVNQVSGNKSRGHIEVEFTGNDTPNQPKLKWFANDDTIRRLIEIRFDEVNTIKAETLELAGKTSATMSQTTATAIDAVKGIKGSVSMSAQASKEHQSAVLFHIEF